MGMAPAQKGMKLVRQGARRGRLVVTTFTLDPEQIQQLDAVAQREERSRSFVVRRALTREFARYRPAAGGRRDPRA